MLSYLLTLITFTPLLGAVVVMFLPRENRAAIRWVSVISSAVSLALCVPLIAGFAGPHERMPFVERHAWIYAIRAEYYLGVDGLSLPLVVLTAALSLLSLIYSWNIEDRTKEYFALFLILEVGMLGTFMALDFFLFYVFWEVSLVPMYFIIGVWGGPRREYAAIKFFLYTLVGSVAMLLAIIYLRLVCGTFDMIRLAQMNPLEGQWPQIALVFWAFFLAFAIKVPLFPFHTWLPDAHVEAPTAGSVILAAILLKMGCYGFLRVILPILPSAAQAFSIHIAVLALISIVYGALVAMAQWDVKKLIAYSSVNHMGYVMLGIAAACSPKLGHFVSRAAALNGAQYEMIAHGILTGALFMLVGVVYDRAHTRDLSSFGGLMVRMPVYAGFFSLAAFGSLGLPGLAGFVAEFLVLVGSLPIYTLLTALASIGIVVTAAFLLWTIQRLFLGPLNPKWAGLPDMDLREIVSLAPLMAAAVILGVYPKPILLVMNTASTFIARLFS
ncbi:MAG: complex I subunit 4 family protein [Armatimonadota bacterium]